MEAHSAPAAAVAGRAVARRPAASAWRRLPEALAVGVRTAATVPLASACWMLCCLQGQGVVPPGSVKVYLTVLVERVLHVDQRDYNFEVSSA